MKTFLIRLLYFVCPFAVVYVLLALFVIPKLIIKTDGPSTASQITHSFNNAEKRNYDLLIVGNSGTYRGINPDSLGIPAYNFSHDNDSYNQIYYKLLWLEKRHKKPKYLVLGIDYFQFSFISDTRNYIYNSFFDSAYSKDYANKNTVGLFLSRTNILEFSRMKYLSNAFKKEQHLIFQKDNGQYIKPGKAFANDKYFYSIKRLPVQEKYFKLILDYCSKNGIEVFLCMLPARKNAMANYTETEIAEFNKYVSSFTDSTIHLYDYSHQAGWSLDDYTDITHLNENAANRFSKQLGNAIKAGIAQYKDSTRIPANITSANR